MTPATPVYVLCLVAALTCTVLLLRAHASSRTRLLFWTGLGFLALTVNNLFLVLDLVVWPGMDLWLPRQAAAAVAVGIFLYGFLWEADR